MSRRDIKDGVIPPRSHIRAFLRKSEKGDRLVRVVALIITSEKKKYLIIFKRFLRRTPPAAVSGLSGYF